jgi:hypothetical protein
MICFRKNRLGFVGVPKTTGVAVLFFRILNIIKLKIHS